MRDIGLCHRCEWRARAHETGHGPRMECSDFGRAVHGCYMYRPVAPVVLVPIEGETRPIDWPPMLAGRARGVRVAEGQIRGRQEDDGLVVWFEPERAVEMPE